MKYLLIFSILLIVGCNKRRGKFIAIDDGLVLDKKSGQVFQIDPEKEPVFRYIGNLKDFQRSLEKEN